LKKNFWVQILLAISLTGVGLSSYLEYVSSQPTCPVGFQGCDIVVTSPYSRIYGVSLSFLGLAWFLILLILTVLASYKNSKNFSYIILGWTLASIPSVAILVWIEVVILNAICIYCTIAHLLGISSIIPAYKLAR
jgi:uncharacterized membrane protein